VQIIGDYTVKLVLSAPFAPLLPRLSDRAGMMMSPKSVQMASDVSWHPVCAGPFKITERVVQDRIVLERFSDYWNRDAIYFQKIIFLPIRDSTIRLSALLSGNLDLIERIAASDIDKVKRSSRVKLAEIAMSGYTGLSININNGPGAKMDLGRDRRIREALELSIDRAALVRVVSDGVYEAGNQWVSPGSPYYVQSLPIPKPDISKAKRLLAEAATPNPQIEIMVQADAELIRAAEVLQAMSSEAGFRTVVRPYDFATALDLTKKGRFQSYLTARSGRIDPDGNIYNFISCSRQSGPNISHYCDQQVEYSLEKSRLTLDPSERMVHFERLAEKLLYDRPIIFLWHAKWLFAMSNRVIGFTPYPDGVIRPQELRFE
jgi:peptide/nickel transport system substrate-binding protein